MRIENKYGFLDAHGNTAIPVVFDFAENFLEGLAIVQIDGRWGVINKLGKYIAKPEFKYEEAIYMAESMRSKMTEQPDPG